MVRPAFDSPYDDSGSGMPINGPQYDASHFGGVGNKVQWVDDGTGTGNTKPIIVGSGREDEVNRYRGMGDAASNRDAYQIDYTSAEQDYARQLQARNEQMGASEQMRQAALGNAPSRSEILSRGALANNFEQQLQGQGQARGIAGQAFAQRQAAQQAQTQNLTAMGQFGAGRAGELDTAMGGYARGANAIRGGDYGAQAQHQQQAAAQMAAELRQRQLNQQAQMAYEKMAFGVNKSEMDADIARRQQYAQRDAMKSQAEQVRKDSEQQVIGATAGGASAMGASALSSPSPKPDPNTINSDERTKRPLGDRMADSVADAVGGAMHGITSRISGVGDVQLDRGEAPARIRARANVIQSDDRTKLAAAWDQGHAAAVADVEKASRYTPQQMREYEGTPAVDAARGISERKWDEGRENARGDVLEAQARGSRMAYEAQSRKGMPDMGKALAQGASPIAFQYKPEFRGEQAPGEENVGVRAQTMAQNRVTGSAVVRQPNGMLGLDVKKATGLNLAAAGYLAQKQQEQEERLRRLEGGGR